MKAEELKPIDTSKYKITETGQVLKMTKEEMKDRKGLMKQLTKAKEIIKDYLTIAKGAHTTVCGVPEENRTIYVLKLNKEAEQFLREGE